MSATDCSIPTPAEVLSSALVDLRLLVGQVEQVALELAEQGALPEAEAARIFALVLSHRLAGHEAAAAVSESLRPDGDDQ